MRAAMRCDSPMKLPTPPPTMPRRSRGTAVSCVIPSRLPWPPYGRSRVRPRQTGRGHRRRCVRARRPRRRTGRPGRPLRRPPGSRRRCRPGETVGPRASPRSSGSATPNRVRASWVGARSRRLRVRIRNSAVFNLSVTVSAPSSARLSRRETRSHSGHRRSASASASAISSANVVSAETLLAARLVLTARASRPTAKRLSRAPMRP